MNDRELLELAAKASRGFEGCKYMDAHRHDYKGWLEAGIVIDDGEASWVWNPLEDDGDALRLAVDLDLDVVFMNGDTLVLNVSEGGGNPYERTRRAIVRAAAVIGQVMP